jgi:selenide,water dikinase
MAQASSVEVHVDMTAVPLLPGAQSHAEAGVDFGGMQRNREHFLDKGLVRLDGLDVATTLLAIDPQTSGGLLLGVPRAHRADLERALAARDVHAWPIGEVADGSGVVVTGR